MSTITLTLSLSTVPLAPYPQPHPSSPAAAAIDANPAAASNPARRGRHRGARLPQLVALSVVVVQARPLARPQRLQLPRAVAARQIYNAMVSGSVRKRTSSHWRQQERRRLLGGSHRVPTTTDASVARFDLLPLIVLSPRCICLVPGISAVAEQAEI
jgi:hypothetical protein